LVGGKGFGKLFSAHLKIGHGSVLLSTIPGKRRERGWGWETGNAGRKSRLKLGVEFPHTFGVLATSLIHFFADSVGDG
jgi:hypothetical protein